MSPAVAAELQSLCGGVLTLSLGPVSSDLFGGICGIMQHQCKLRKEGDTFNMLDSAALVQVMRLYRRFLSSESRLWQPQAMPRPCSWMGPRAG